LTLAAIFGCSGPELDPNEAAFFGEIQPWGFILFGRNIQTPDQVRALTGALRACVGRPDAPILIDQEGGRVQRLCAPHWRRFPPARAFGSLDSRFSGPELSFLGARLIANDLLDLGVTVDCMPVLDVPAPEAHDIIGDRAYADDPAQVAILGRAAAEGLLAGGVLPVIKHIPGHGRATADSHLALPRVDAAYEALEERDFAAFRPLADMPIAMTAHVVYAAIDDRKPATTSRKVITEIVRGAIGFDGLLVSDDLSMNALSGDLRTRAEESSAAGCDVVLHCNGEIAEMGAVAAGAGDLAGRSAERAAAALALVAGGGEPLDVEDARRRFDAAFANARAA
jgi:beta-N-acetylhexosaminidase